jgi:uncharacterized membrane protein
MHELIVLRLLHVLGGIFWLGSGLFTMLFLLPALAEAGPQAGSVMAAMQRRRLFTVLPLVASVTVLTGARLLWIVSGGLDADYFASASGAAFASSGAAALLAWAVGVLGTGPMQARAARLGHELAAMSDDAARSTQVQRVAALRRRAGVLQRVTLALLLLGAAGMAVARYLR